MRYLAALTMPTFRRHPVQLTLACAVACALATVAASGPAWAQGQPQPAPTQQQERPSDHRALSDAVRRVERATNGQVLSAERVQFDGRDVNRVKIIDDRGRVRVYWDDPQSRRAEREQLDSVRNDHRRAEPPRRDDDPPRRTRRHDGAAFNL